jgi:hypothetical protein
MVVNQTVKTIYRAVQGPVMDVMKSMQINEDGRKDIRGSSKETSPMSVFLFRGF